jgi:hypothetical protein
LLEMVRPSRDAPLFMDGYFEAIRMESQQAR